MKALVKHREAWPDKTDGWLFERLSNELKDKVSEIHLLLEEIRALRQEQQECDCQDKKRKSIY